MNTINKSFRALFADARKTLAYAVEGAVLDFTEQVLARMNTLNTSRSALAERLGSSAAYVTKLLRGTTNNFTLESMVKVASALDADIKLELVPKIPASAWVEAVERKAPHKNREAVIYYNFKKTEITPEGRAFRGICLEELDNEAIATPA